MAVALPIGHRRKGAGLTTDLVPELIKAIELSRDHDRTMYVDSAAASGGNGDSWSGAYTTLAAAVAVAHPDDLILVAPGHTETVAAEGGIDIGVAGLKIIGLGMGSRRPTFTLSAVASDINIDAAGVALHNLLFLTTAACTIVLDINATDVLVSHCEFRRSSGTHPVVWIDVNGGAANACDRTKIVGCVLNSGTGTGADEFIELGEVADGVIIADCVVFGDFANACIHNPTGKVLTNLTVMDCFLANLQTGDHSIELVSACTGALIRNLYHNNMTQATGSDPGSCFSFECYHDDVIDTSAIVSPAVT